MFSKKQIINAIAVLGRKLGRAPSVLAFVARSGISRRSVQRFFPTWNDAVRAAGLQPHTQNAKVEEQALLEDWGQAVRRNRGIPTHHGYLHEGKYNPTTIHRRFGGWSSLPGVFRNFAKGRPEWADVLALLPAHPPKKHTKRPKEAAGSPILPGQAPHAPLKNRATYGEPTAFRWLRHEPVNEQGVVLLFGMLAKELGYIIETVQTGFPDCEAKRQIGPQRWQRVLIEFEFDSRNFRDHGHAATGCDLIVCWRHNWSECPAHIEVLELSHVIKSLPTPAD